MPSKRNKLAVPRKAWALVRPNGRIDVNTVKATKADAIWEECYGQGFCVADIWASRRAQGWRVVKVEIREVK